MFAHIDADSFFASVLVRKHPHLRGKPLLALGMGGGCVISASYEAKKFGVKTGMRVSEAKALVPNAIAMPSDFAETGMASDQIETIIRHCGSAVEEMSVDEWFLDLRSIPGGIPKNLPRWTEQIRGEILTRTAISVSVGVGPTKLLAKMASEYRKPAGRTVIGASNTDDDATISLKTFLADRPAAAIPGIGRKRVLHTDAHGWSTALDIAQAPNDELKKLFGVTGPELKSELCGVVVHEIVTNPEPPKSLSRARSFVPTHSREILWAHGLRHLEYLTLKLRRHLLSARGMGLWLRDGTYKGWNGTQCRIPLPVHTQVELFPLFATAFEEVWEQRKRYTQIGLSLFPLTPRGPSQLSLLEAPETQEHNEALQASLDTLHERFGRNAITRASALPVRSGTKHHLELTVVGSGESYDLWDLESD